LGASEEELKETMAVAMTVGATKIQLRQQGASGSLTHQQPSGSPTQPELKTLNTLPPSGVT